MLLWQSKNPAVSLVNEKLTAAGHDLTTDAANAAWYGGLPDKQRWAEQLASALLPKAPGKKNGDLPERLFAEHLYWLSRKDGRYRKDGWHWRYEPLEELARVFGYASEDPVKRATASLKKSDLIMSKQRFITGTTRSVNHYRLTDEAHVILGLLTLAGVGDLGRGQWLELLYPLDPKAKPLRDVLTGWQEVTTPEAVEALLEALKAAVVRVDPEGLNNLPRVLNDAWNAALKADYPDATPASVATNKKLLAVILKKLKNEAEEPGATFTLTTEAVTKFGLVTVKGWQEFRQAVKKEKGEKLPDLPSLEKLQWHVPLAVKSAFKGITLIPLPNAKPGWDASLIE